MRHTRGAPEGRPTGKAREATSQLPLASIFVPLSHSRISIHLKLRNLDVRLYIVVHSVNEKNADQKDNSSKIVISQHQLLRCGLTSTLVNFA